MAEASTITREMIEAAAGQSQPGSDTGDQSFRKLMQKAKKHANASEQILIKLSLPASIAMRSYSNARYAINSIRALAPMSAQRSLVIFSIRRFFVASGIKSETIYKSIHPDQLASECCICAALATGGARG